MEQRSYLKRHFAHPAFAIATIDTWLRHYPRDLRIRVEVVGDDGAGEAAEGPYAVISNSDPYTYVGRRRMSIAPEASLDRALAVTVLASLRAGLLVPATGSRGGHARRFVERSPGIVQVADVTAVTVSADRPFPWQVDGDYLGEVDHLDVGYEPDQLTLVVPV